MPRTRSAGSTTHRSSVPIRQVPTAWYTDVARFGSSRGQRGPVRVVGPGVQLQADLVGDDLAGHHLADELDPVEEQPAVVGFGQVARVDDRRGGRVRRGEPQGTPALRVDQRGHDRQGGALVDLLPGR